MTQHNNFTNKISYWYKLNMAVTKKLTRKCLQKPHLHECVVFAESDENEC